MRRFVPAGLSLTLVGAPAAAQALLDVDESQSSITVEVSALTRSDSDTSPVGGFFEVDLDDYASPTQVWVWDFDLEVTQTMNITISAGFLGSFSVTMTGVGVSLAGAGPVGPGAVDANGDFAIADVPADLRGTGDYSGTGLFSAVGSGTIDLGDFSPTTAALAGNVAVAGGVVTLEASVSNSITQDISGIDVTVSVDGDVVATGDVPTCPADLTGEGDVNTNDFFAFLALYQAQDARADFAPDGMINTNDFFAFLAAYQAGC